MPDHAKRQHPTRPARNTETTQDCPRDTVVPLHKPQSRGNISIERIETEPMTPDEYNQAVTIFATLINQWKSHANHQPPDSEIAA